MTPNQLPVSPIEKALSKLRSAQICHPNAVQHLIDEAIATLAAISQQAQEPVGDRYFSYSTDMGFEEFATQQEAIDCSNVQINGYRDDAIRDDEWPDEVDSVCWGVILGRSKEIDTSNEDHESVDYKLHTTPPAPQVPAKCLTCNGHGLIGGHMPDGSGHGEPCPDCNAPQVPAPVDEREAWLPIESAPKERGARFIGLTTSGRAITAEPMYCVYDGPPEFRGWHEVERGSYIHADLQGWMPLPKAPQTKGQP